MFVQPLSWAAGIIALAVISTYGFVDPDMAGTLVIALSALAVISIDRRSCRPTRTDQRA